MLYPKAMHILQFLLAAVQIQTSTQTPVDTAADLQRGHSTRTIAGVSVIDTPIVRAAHEFARNHTSDFIYKHVMRGWLFGALIIEHNETLRTTVDLEVHAVAALLHDLGWDQTAHSPFISTDRRFEVDGAIAARNFIKHSGHGKSWDDRRTQLLWDSIALHTQPSISQYKELEVAVTGNGIVADFEGPILGITKQQFAAVVKEFPNSDLLKGVNETIVWLCHSKPSSTYDTWMQPWGEHYVANYSVVGHRLFDLVSINES